MGEVFFLETQKNYPKVQQNTLLLSAISTVKIQHVLQFLVNDVKQVWLVDDATGSGSLKSF